MTGKGATHTHLHHSWHGCWLHNAPQRPTHLGLDVAQVGWGVQEAALQAPLRSASEQRIGEA